MEYLAQLRGSVALASPAVNDHVLSDGPNLSRKAVEADSPAEAADILLSELTDRRVVDEVWVQRDDHTWVYRSDGALLREGTTSDIE